MKPSWAITTDQLNGMYSGVSQMNGPPGQYTSVLVVVTPNASAGSSPNPTTRPNSSSRAMTGSRVTSRYRP